MEQHDPTDLLLLGDNIYMDYGWLGRRRNGSSRKLGLSDFSARMRDAYEEQWQVATFRRFIDGRPVYATWDDHDFAWDNARGGGLSEDEEHVPKAHREVARLHFETFREALSASPKPEILPPDPAPAGVPRRRVAASVATTVTLSAGVRMHVLDARTFREQRGGSLLGEAQRLALATALLPPPGVNLLASSSTLEEWAEYPIDFDWLTHHARSYRILVLSGDKHKPRFRQRRALVRGDGERARAAARARSTARSQDARLRAPRHRRRLADDSALHRRLACRPSPDLTCRLVADDSQRIVS